MIIKSRITLLLALLLVSSGLAAQTLEALPIDAQPILVKPVENYELNRCEETESVPWVLLQRMMEHTNRSLIAVESFLLAYPFFEALYGKDGMESFVRHIDTSGFTDIHHGPYLRGSSPVANVIQLSGLANGYESLTQIIESSGEKSALSNVPNEILSHGMLLVFHDYFGVYGQPTKAKDYLAEAREQAGSGALADRPYKLLNTLNYLPEEEYSKYAPQLWQQLDGLLFKDPGSYTEMTLLASAAMVAFYQGDQKTGQPYFEAAMARDIPYPQHRLDVDIIRLLLSRAYSGRVEFMEEYRRIKESITAEAIVNHREDLWRYCTELTVLGEPELAFQLVPLILTQVSLDQQMYNRDLAAFLTVLLNLDPEIEIPEGLFELLMELSPQV
jgi:hypothetical protein